MSDDLELIAEILKGRTAAFENLVRKYQDRLFNSVAYMVGNVEDARDIVQEAFVQAFLNLRTFQGTSAFYTWLYRIAFNVAATERRRKRPKISVERGRDRTGREPIDGQPGPAERVEREERGRRVRQGLSQLSEEHRAVLVLREIDGCRYETIAEILGLPIGTIRSRLHRARLELREELKNALID
ncbi:MAG: sigma-70 family RNA polymerase sigma factor [Pirellulales bacterium]|nr:sigma-70 family RNA polymerase sigma factor [Pirellulales bacterium]